MGGVGPSDVLVPICLTLKAQINTCTEPGGKPSASVDVLSTKEYLLKDYSSVGQQQQPYLRCITESNLEVTKEWLT